MEKISISKIAADESGKINVYPKLALDRDFAFIYRAAMGVTWDSERRCLLPQEVRTWGHFEWFKQIVAAAADEYGKQLVLSKYTRWRGVTKKTRIKIEAWQKENAA